MSAKIPDLGKYYLTSSLYVRTSDKRSLFTTETYNYESMPTEEFLVSATPCTEGGADSVRAQRLVLVTGDGEHVPIFRSRIHYILAKDEVAFSGDKHPASQIAQTTYKEQLMNVVKVQAGYFAPKSFGKFGDLKEELNKMGLEFSERRAKADHRGKLPSVSAVLGGQAAASSSSDTPKKKKKEQKKHSDRPSSSAITSESGDSLSPYVSHHLTTLLKKKFNTSPSSADPAALGWTLKAEGSDATETELRRLIPDIHEVQVSDPDYRLSLCANVREGYYILFDDSKLSTYSLYEGFKQGKDIACPSTGIRFCCKAKHSPSSV